MSDRHPVQTYEITYRPSGATEIVPAAVVTSPHGDGQHFQFFDNGLLLSVHQENVSSVRPVETTSE